MAAEGVSSPADDNVEPEDILNSDVEESKGSSVEEEIESVESPPPTPMPLATQAAPAIGKVHRLTKFFEQLGSPTSATQSFATQSFAVQESEVEKPAMALSTVPAAAAFSATTVNPISGGYEDSNPADHAGYLTFNSGTDGKLTGTYEPRGSIFPPSVKGMSFNFEGVQNTHATEPSFSLHLRLDVPSVNMCVAITGVKLATSPALSVKIALSDFDYLGTDAADQVISTIFI